MILKKLSSSIHKYMRAFLDGQLKLQHQTWKKMATKAIIYLVIECLWSMVRREELEAPNIHVAENGSNGGKYGIDV